MKVLMISEYFPPEGIGGGEISAHLLAKSLVKKNIDMHVLTSTGNTPYFELMDGIKIHRLLKTGSPKTVSGNIKRISFSKNLRKKVIELEKKENFDIIHCMNTSSISAVKCIAKPFVMHVNGPVPFCPKGTLVYKDKVSCDKRCTLLTYCDCALNSQIIGKTKQSGFMMPFFLVPLRFRYNSYRSCMKKFDYYMPISTYMEKKLLENGIPKNKIRIIYNLEEKTKEDSRIKARKNKVLYLGDYTKAKGADLALRAITSLNLEASFYGEGNLEGFLRENAGKKVKINARVSHSEIKKIIMEHDIVLFPSFVGEAFGRVAMESCLLKKTVIASEIGGITDIIEDRVTGFLFEPGDIEGLTNTLKNVTEGKLNIDKEKMVKILEKKFLEKKTISDVISIYDKLIAKQF